MTVTLAPGTNVDLRPLERHFVTTSACGVCGKAALEDLEVRVRPKPDEGVMTASSSPSSLP